MNPLPQKSGKLPATFARTLATHQGALRAYALSLVVDPYAADEVVQNTNAALCRKASQFESGTNFKAWAFRAARFEVAKYRRSVARGRLVFDDELLDKIEAPAADEDALYETRRKRLLHCLRKLSPLQRHLVIEHHLEAKPVKEIAAERGRTPNAVSLVLFRAREALMACVSSFDRDDIPPSAQGDTT